MCSAIVMFVTFRLSLTKTERTTLTSHQGCLYYMYLDKYLSNFLQLSRISSNSWLLTDLSVSQSEADLDKIFRNHYTCYYGFFTVTSTHCSLRDNGCLELQIFFFFLNSCSPSWYLEQQGQRDADLFSTLRSPPAFVTAARVVFGSHCWPTSTVYPKTYAHGFCFAVLCCGYTLTDFPISIRLTSLALWQSNDCPSASKATLMNMDKYFMWIHYERLHNHNKAKHNKTVCIFLGIYCTMVMSFWRQGSNADHVPGIIVSVAFVPSSKIWTNIELILTLTSHINDHISWISVYSGDLTEAWLYKC